MFLLVNIGREHKFCVGFGSVFGEFSAKFNEGTDHAETT